MELYPHQKEALSKMKNGCILNGGTGSGKSITSIAYYFVKVCGGEIEPEYVPMSDPRPLYIITTAKKRDDGEWNNDLAPFLLSSHKDANIYYNDAPVIIDSWNNIKKYQSVYGAFFIFDEQRLVGSGAWVKAFYKIAKKNKWILLTATPGDKWEDYIPVFVANGFYKNKTEFKELHMEMDPYVHYKVRRYHNTGRLLKQREQLLIKMDFERETVQHHKYILCAYDRDSEKNTIRTRWNPFTNEPITEASELCYVLRKIANADESRVDEIVQLHENKHPRMIIFYNFNYELEILREMCDKWGYTYFEWNGQKHEKIDDSVDEWLYLVQYTAGAEGWNCITCRAMLFYSANYSYKTMVQASGRIDRINTPYKDLYYYHLYSNSIIDKAIGHALNKKKKFNEKKFISAL